jgi:hypothetical protein
MRKGLAAVMAALLAVSAGAASAAPADRRLVLVTLDGLHWTEVFKGAEPTRAADRTFVREPAAIRKDFVDVPDRARALMPFLNGVVAKQGVLLGDRDHGSCMALANDMWFSYPGYNEILTGKPDPKITSNEHGPNANVTFLEWLNRRPEFKGRVEAVASWNAYDDILNARRSGLPVNDGWGDAPKRTPTETQIARIQGDAARIWLTVRQDAFTHAYAMEAIKARKPRVLYVAYGETDDFAHDGHYDQVLWAAHRSDAFIAEIWKTLQADPTYAGKTTLIVTTDHGRGVGGPSAWKSHGKPQHVQSDATWLAAIGPDIAPGKRLSADCASSSQIAATALKALGLSSDDFDPAAGKPLEVFR